MRTIYEWGEGPALIRIVVQDQGGINPATREPKQVATVQAGDQDGVGKAGLKKLAADVEDAIQTLESLSIRGVSIEAPASFDGGIVAQGE